MIYSNTIFSACLNLFNYCDQIGRPAENPKPGRLCRGACSFSLRLPFMNAKMTNHLLMKSSINNLNLNVQITWPGEWNKSVVIVYLHGDRSVAQVERSYSNINCDSCCYISIDLHQDSNKWLRIKSFQSFWENQPIFINLLALKPFFLHPCDPSPALHLFSNNVQREFILGNLINFVILC